MRRWRVRIRTSELSREMPGAGRPKMDDSTTNSAELTPIPIMKPGAPNGSLDVRFDRDGMVWVGSMMQGSLVKFDPKTEKFQSWGAPDFLKRDDARIAMVMPEQHRTRLNLANKSQQIIPIRMGGQIKIINLASPRNLAGAGAQNERIARF